LPGKELFALVNASLNGLAGLLLIVAVILIKKRRYAAHGWTMSLAVLCSAAFLVCYVVSKILYDTQTLKVPPGWFRTTYFLVLVPHLILAIAVLPMIVMTLWRAARRRWEAHRRIAPYTYGVWMFVSVTGVLIYFMLYRWAPAMYPESFAK